MSSQQFKIIARTVLAACVCLALAVSVASCSGDSDEETGLAGKRPVRVIPIEFDQQIVIPSSVLKFDLRGTERLVAGRARVQISGVLATSDKVQQTFEV